MLDDKLNEPEVFLSSNSSYVGGMVDINHPILRDLWPHAYSTLIDVYVPLKFLGYLNDEGIDVLLFLGFETVDYDGEFDMVNGVNAALSLEFIPDWVRMLPLGDTKQPIWSKHVTSFNSLDHDIETVENTHWIDNLKGKTLIGIIESAFDDNFDFNFGDGEDLLIFKDAENQYFVAGTNKG